MSKETETIDLEEEVKKAAEELDAILSEITLKTNTLDSIVCNLLFLIFILFSFSFILFSFFSFF